MASDLEQQLGDILANAENKGDMMRAEEKPEEEVRFGGWGYDGETTAISR